MMYAGKKIKVARVAKGYSQEELADLIGKTRPLVSSIEQTGKGSIHTLRKICQVLGIEMDMLENDANEPDTYYISGSKVKQLESEIDQLRRDNELLRDLVQSQKDLIAELKAKGNAKYKK
jgi:transcriptional regulator with XRE-family HTH domain